MRKKQPQTAASIPEVDARDYVQFLFSIPVYTRRDDPLRLGGKHPISENDLFQVGRTLFQLAQLADKRDSPDLCRFAEQVWLLPLRYRFDGDEPTRNRLAPPDKAKTVLGRIAGRVNSELCAKAVEMLDDFEVSTKDSFIRSSVEYRGDGGSFAFPRKYRHPEDDLTFRIVEARRALKEAGCPQPIAYIASTLDSSALQSLSRAQIVSRLRPYKAKDVAKDVTDFRAMLPVPYRDWYVLRRLAIPSPRTEAELEKPFNLKPWDETGRKGTAR